MPKFLLGLFMMLSISTLCYADAWETITGPTLLQGVVLMAGSNNVPVNSSGQVQHLVVIVIKDIISGDARKDYSLAFSYNGAPKEMLKSGDIIRVSFENDEKLSSFSAITKLGTIFKAK